MNDEILKLAEKYGYFPDVRFEDLYRAAYNKAIEDAMTVCDEIPGNKCDMMIDCKAAIIALEMK